MFVQPRMSTKVQRSKLWSSGLTFSYRIPLPGRMMFYHLTKSILPHNRSSLARHVHISSFVTTAGGWSLALRLLALTRTLGLGVTKAHLLLYSWLYNCCLFTASRNQSDPDVRVRISFVLPANEMASPRVKKSET